jgi:putative addiction module component (TIGR02574 family)
MSALPPEFAGMSSVEKIDLARQLLNSIPDEDTLLTEAQMADLRLRIAEFEQDPDEGQDWEEFKAELERES